MLFKKIIDAMYFDGVNFHGYEHTTDEENITTITIDNMKRSCVIPCYIFKSDNILLWQDKILFESNWNPV